MRILLYLGHPAHFHLFKNVVCELKLRGHEVETLIKTKDVLEELLQASEWTYKNISKRERGASRLQIFWGLLARDVAVIRVARVFRPHLMIGTSAEIAHAGKLLGTPSIVVNEDDHDVVPLFARAAYPFATTILAPSSCRMGRWIDKTATYESYHELAYLHPDVFAPDPEVARRLSPSGERYFILRFAKLTAHHDAGRSGIVPEIADRVVKMLEPHGKVYITAERQLEPEFEKYRISINPLEIHNALHFAHLYVGDSQTMAAEAAVLGTPSLRFNDFVGEIGYLNELEQRYGLTYGIPTSEPEQLYAKIESLLRTKDLAQKWKERRQRMLAEKIDLTAFMVWFIENYADSLRSRRGKSIRAEPLQVGRELSLEITRASRT